MEQGSVFVGPFHGNLLVCPTRVLIIICHDWEYELLQSDFHKYVRNLALPQIVLANCCSARFAAELRDVCSASVIYGTTRVLEYEEIDGQAENQAFILSEGCLVPNLDAGLWVGFELEIVLFKMWHELETLSVDPYGPDVHDLGDEIQMLSIKPGRGSSLMDVD